MQAERARGSPILRQPHASCACTSVIDISKNSAVAIATVERDMAGPHSMFTHKINTTCPRQLERTTLIVAGDSFAIDDAGTRA